MGKLLKIILFLCTKTLIIFKPFIKAGRHTVIYPNALISRRYGKGATLTIGVDSRIGCLSQGYKIGWFHPVRISLRAPYANISIGNNCELNGANIYCRNKIIIGNNAKIAGGVIITDTNGHSVYNRNQVDNPKPVILGNNIWIGLNSIILKGTEIGDNSIVGAGSVVQGTFPPFSMIKGNPATVVKIMDSNKFS